MKTYRMAVIVPRGKRIASEARTNFGRTANLCIRGEIIIILRFERRVCRWESCRMHHLYLRFAIGDFRFIGVWFASNSREAGLRNREPWRCNSSHADHFLNRQSKI